MRRWVSAAGLAVLVFLGGTGVATAAGPAGVQARHLPPGVGRPTDLHYVVSGVRFDERVWESGLGGPHWSVDVDLTVLRGPRLRTAAAAHRWFMRQAGTPAGLDYRRVDVRGRRAWVTRSQAFWLVRPGLAISVQLNPARWSRREVIRTARGVLVPPTLR